MERRVVVLDFERTITVSRVPEKREVGQSWLPDIGAVRLPILCSFLRALGDVGVSVLLISARHTEAAMAECLAELELSQHVSVIIDSVELAEGGSCSCTDTQAKQTLLAELVLEHALQPHEILAIDADGDTLRGAPCRILHVEGGGGLSEADAQRALIMLGLEPDF